MWLWLEIDLASTSSWVQFPVLENKIKVRLFKYYSKMCRRRKWRIKEEKLKLES